MEIELRKILYLPRKEEAFNFTEILGRKPDIIDPLFQKFFSLIGDKYTAPRLEYWVHTIKNVSSVLDVPLISQSEAHNLCAVMATLGPSGLLVIPHRSDETEVVFGRTIVDDTEVVLLIEHEYKYGRDQIHCHARPAWEWRNDKSTLVTRKA